MGLEIKRLSLQERYRLIGKLIEEIKIVEEFNNDK
jgi:hypothetical protein